jgi:hypothetical protein
LFVEGLTERGNGQNGSVLAQLGARIEGARIGVTRGVGVGVGITAGDGSPSSSLRASDVYVGELALAELTFTATSERSSLGLFSRRGSSLECDRCTVRGASYGISIDRGAVRLRDAMILESLDAAGIQTPGGPAPVLERVGMRSNARDELRGGALPDVSFALPTGLCPERGC